MKKTALFLVSVLLVLGGAAGQNGSSTGHFDWAKGYGSAVPNSLSCIKGTVTDSLGNLYILGQFRNDAEWDGERILPMTPYGPACSPTNVLIAKISPSGEMVWKKVVHGNDGNQARADDIKPLGDTGFAVMFYFSPHGPNLANTRYLYWLDTLYTSEYYPFNPYQYPDRRFSDVVCNAYVAFDFDGNVKEQHFLERSYVDSAGNDLMWQPWSNPDSLRLLRMQYLQYVTFDVDSAGNIYICRKSVDSYGSDYQASEGTLTAVKFWVDHRMVGECSLEHRPQEWYPHLLKFSPHFDTLLENRYVIQKSDNSYFYETPQFIQIDKKNNQVFLIANLSPIQQTDNILFIDTTLGLSYTHTSRNQMLGFLTIYNSTIQPLALIYLTDSVIDNNSSIYSNIVYHGLAFDYDSNLFFVAASTGRGYNGDTNHYYSMLQYRGETLQLKNDAFFMSFIRNTYPPILYSYGRVPSIGGSEVGPSSQLGGTPGCGNNRLFLQSHYLGGIRHPNSFIDYHNTQEKGRGFVSFDYQGHCIGGADYNALGYNNRIECLSYRDSTLYLMNFLHSDAVFGDIHVSPYCDFVCIAKYVDASFMTPYVYTPQEGGEHVDLTENTPCTLYPNPVRDKLYVSMDEPVVEASVMTLTGIKKQIPFNGNMLDIASLQPGVYILEIVTNQHIYRHKIIKL